MATTQRPAHRLEPIGTGESLVLGDDMNDSTTFSAATLDRFYRMPASWRREDDYYRARHEDLAELTDRELRTELRCVRRRLDYETDDANKAWLAAREDAVLAEMACRRRSSPHQSDVTPTPAAPVGPHRTDRRRVTSATMVDGELVAR